MACIKLKYTVPNTMFGIPNVVQPCLFEILNSTHLYVYMFGIPTCGILRIFRSSTDPECQVLACCVLVVDLLPGTINWSTLLGFSVKNILKQKISSTHTAGSPKLACSLNSPWNCLLHSIFQVQFHAYTSDVLISYRMDYTNFVTLLV